MPLVTRIRITVIMDILTIPTGGLDSDFTSARASIVADITGSAASLSTFVLASFGGPLLQRPVFLI